MKSKGLGEMVFHPHYEGDVKEMYERHGALEIFFQDDSWVSFWHMPPSDEDVLEEISGKEIRMIRACRWGRRFAYKLAKDADLGLAASFSPWVAYSVNGSQPLPVEENYWHNSKFYHSDGTLKEEYRQMALVLRIRVRIERRSNFSTSLGDRMPSEEVQIFEDSDGQRWYYLFGQLRMWPYTDDKLGIWNSNNTVRVLPLTWYN